MKQGFSTLLFLLFLIALAAIGYFSWKNLSHPSQYVDQKNETIGDLHEIASEDTSDVSTENPQPTTDQAAPSSEETNPLLTPSSPKNTSPNTATPSSTGSSVATTLKNLLQQKTVLKIGSQGPSVGALQKVMNAYFTKNLKIDNDFGKTLETDLKKFQTQNKITPTGQTGPQTLQKLIDWVGKHPVS